jgi:hypothetical protein
MALHEIFQNTPVTIAEICKELASIPELMDLLPDTFEAPLDERGYIRPNFKKRLGKVLFSVKVPVMESHKCGLSVVLMTVIQR